MYEGVRRSLSTCRDSQQTISPGWARQLLIDPNSQWINTLILTEDLRGAGESSFGPSMYKPGSTILG